MDDINDIGSVLFFWDNSFIVYPVILLVFFILFYFVLDKYLRDDSSSDKIDNKIKVSSRGEIDEIIQSLIVLKKDFLSLEKEDFYEKLNMIFRRYFEYLGIGGASKMSLRELEIKVFRENDKLKIDAVVLASFRESYFGEFDSKKDDLKTRNKIIDKFIEKLEVINS